jgi:hypothetical protein
MVESGGKSAEYEISTDGTAEGTFVYSLDEEEWVKGVTASTSKDGSLVVVTAVLDFEAIPSFYW